MSYRARTLLFAVTASASLRFLSGQLRRLSQRGWDMGVVSGDHPADLEAFAEREGVLGYSVPMHREISPLSDLRAVAGLYRLMRAVRPEISNVGTPKAGLVGGLAAALAGVPVRVYTLHGLRMETSQGARRALLEGAERLAMACAHRVVCVSPSLERRVHELGLTGQHKTLVLGPGTPNGVPLPDLAALAGRTAQLREELELPEGTPVIGFVGRFTRDKGMAELMTAFAELRAELPQVRLLMIGEHEAGDAVAPEVRAHMDAADGLIYAGFVQDVTPYYLLMTVLTLPTYREGFPTVVLEAAACGLPVVTTDATGAIDAVQDGVTGWQVPVGDAGALAAALRAALSDPAEAKRRGRAGQVWVREMFDPQDVQERWAALYDELAEWNRLRQRRPLKRALDAGLAGAGLALLGVPLLGLALLVRIRLGSPVLFTQVRPGLGGQPFTMYKFRTMTDARGPNGELLPDEVRLTPFGRFLRSTSLDELPELVNVLRGEMSLVGPRPLLMEYLPLYSGQQRRRHEVRPGITGWAQVNGRNALSWEQKFDLDVWYVDNHSLWLDPRILLLTLKKVVVREGISAQGEATMPRFRGTLEG